MVAGTLENDKAGEGGGAGAVVLRATCLQIEIWGRDPGEFLGVCTSMP